MGGLDVGCSDIHLTSSPASDINLAASTSPGTGIECNLSALSFFQTYPHPVFLLSADRILEHFGRYPETQANLPGQAFEPILTEDVETKQSTRKTFLGKGKAQGEPQNPYQGMNGHSEDPGFLGHQSSMSPAHHPNGDIPSLNPTNAPIATFSTTGTIPQIEDLGTGALQPYVYTHLIPKVVRDAVKIVPRT
jgi:hypothetical protein